MSECPDYGDPCLVPRDWYTKISSYQEIRWGWEFDEFHGVKMPRPVVLRGARHCRMAKFRTQSDYGYTVVMRLLRMRRMTATDPVKWYMWCTSVLFPMCAKKPWWHRQQSLWSISSMVREWMVLIDGEFVAVYDKKQMANVKKIHAAIARLDNRAKIR